MKMEYKRILKARSMTMTCQPPNLQRENIMSFIVKEKDAATLTTDQMSSIKLRLLITSILTPLSWILGFCIGLGLPAAVAYALDISKDSPLLIVFGIISFVFLIGIPYYFGIIVKKIKNSSSNIYKQTLVLPKLKQSLGVLDYSWNTIGLEHFEHLINTCSSTAYTSEIDDIFNACYRGLPLLFTDNEVYVNKTIFRISTLIISLPCQIADSNIYTLKKSNHSNKTVPLFSYDIMHNDYFNKHYQIMKTAVPNKDSNITEDQILSHVRHESLLSFVNSDNSQNLSEVEERVQRMIRWLLQTSPKEVPQPESPSLSKLLNDTSSEIENPITLTPDWSNTLPGISAENFFTQSLAEALLNSKFGDYEIMLHGHFLYISLEFPHSGIKNLFDLRFTDLFRTQDAISQRIDREINVLTNLLDEIIDIITFAPQKI